MPPTLPRSNRPVSLIWLPLNKLPIKRPLPLPQLNPTSLAVDPTQLATAVAVAAAAHPDTAHSRLPPTATEALHPRLAMEVHLQDPAIENMEERLASRDLISPFNRLLHTTRNELSFVSHPLMFSCAASLDFHKEFTFFYQNIQYISNGILRMGTKYSKWIVK
jgi:hypothetical protein